MARRIIHNGAALWADFVRSGPADFDRLAGFLFGYFDAAAKENDFVVAMSGWQEAVSLWLDLSASRSDDLRGAPGPVEIIRDAALRDLGLSAARPVPDTIFVSHRQNDAAWSIELADHILAHGRFDAWLDIRRLTAPLPPGLSARQQSLLTAMIIEMGLVNAHGLVALVTPNSRGSGWIPYEYGRAKAPGPLARQAAAYLRGGMTEDYMELAPLLGHAGGPTIPPDLRAWLDGI